MYEVDIHNKLKEITCKQDVKLNFTPDKVGGDISTNAAMASGVDAKEIVDELKKLDFIEEFNIVGPGFINMSVKKDILNKEVIEISQKEKLYGGGKEKGRIIFEMVSSNPTGPLHIGHGRGAVIGDTLGRISEHLGYKVTREYYVNDTGTQMSLLGESILSRMKGEEPPLDGYKGEYIKEVAEKLKSCATARQCSEKASQMIINKHFEVLKKFGVHYENRVFESSLIKKNKVKQILDILSQKDLTYEKDGAVWFKSSMFNDNSDRVLKKNNGELTYFASDCAYHKDKAERADIVVNIWGADHHGYIGRLNSFWKAMDYDKDKLLDIIIYQLVNLKKGGKKVSMSTRQGKFITLQEVLEEVGTDAARYFLLMRSPDSPLEFDLNLAKQESKKNPVYYIQYSHARICSVFKKAGVSPESLNFKLALELGREEKEVIKILAHFPYVIRKCMFLKAPHLLTEYLKDLATSFHKYYDTVRILGSEKEEARLVLLKAVKDVAKTGLSLAGVSAPEIM
ncbi:MAG: arginine--tRNA ligase [Elusimicrobiota bacterium]